MPDLQWARLKTDVKCGLRRGAWYRVIRLTPEEAILDVDRKPITIARDHLDLVSIPPDHWTVVPRPRDVVGPAVGWGDSYGVCPNCHHRAPLRRQPLELACSKCGGVFKVAWETPYLAGPRGGRQGST
jgi:hypothetical protein